jgi:DNA repair protein SbcC/Rad50
MIPVETTVENFMTHRGKVSINFLPIKNAIVYGANGAGKSSLIVDPILFALFGSYRSRIADIIHESEDRCTVSFKFTKSDHVYEVTRVIHREKPSTLSLKEDDIPLKKERLKGTVQETLNNILGFNEKILLATCISQQDETNLLSNMRPSEREEILTTFLNLDIWYEKKQKAQEYITLRQDLDIATSQLEEEVKSLEIQNDQNDLLIKTTKSEIQVLTPRYQKQKGVVESLYKSFQENKSQQLLRDEVLNLEGTLKHLKTELNQTTNLYSIDQIEAEYLELEQRHDLLGKEKDDISEILSNTNTELLDIMTEINSIKNLQANEKQCEILDIVPCIGTEYHDKCLLLEKAQEAKNAISYFVTVNNANDLNEIASNKTRKYNELHNKYKELESQRRSIDLDIGRALSKLLDFKNNKIDPLNKKDTLEKQYNEAEKLYQDKNSQLQGVLFDPTSLYDAQATLHSLELQLSDLQTRLNNLLTKQNFDLKLWQSKKEELVKLRKEKQLYINYKVLHQAYSDIPSLLFNNTIPHIESYANYLLQEISPDKRMFLRTHRDTQKGTQMKSLDLLCSTPGGLRSFESLSGSEKFRHSLAFRLALAWVNSEMYNVPFNFFIIDEGFGSIDSESILVIKQMLRFIASKFNLFLVITHVDELKDTFDTQIVINPEGSKKRVIILK